jgi:hypothetical protein
VEREKSGDIELESAVSGDIDLCGADFETFGESGEEFGGHLWEEGTGEDAVHVAGTAVDFGAASDDVIENGVGPHEIGAVVFANATADFAELEFSDLSHDGIAEWEVGDNDDASEEGGLEGFEKFGVQGFGESGV